MAGRERRRIVLGLGIFEKNVENNHDRIHEELRKDSRGFSRSLQEWKMIRCHSEVIFYQITSYYESTKSYNPPIYKL